MNTPKRRHPALLISGALILIVGVVSVIQRDAIAGLILRGGDTSLTGPAAQNSPEAKLAMDFLGALRTTDTLAMSRLATAEQIDRMRDEIAHPTADAQQLRAMMLEDLPADQANLQSTIKSLQTHEKLAVVTFETKANTWFVQLALVDGVWKVSGF